MTTPEPSSDVTAAELALGLLEGEERAAAMRRVLADRAFAAAVDRWRSEFGTLHAEWPDEIPPADGLARLDAALDGSALARAERAARRWRFAAMAASVVAAVAAALVLTLAVRPTDPGRKKPVASSPALLVAAIKPVGGKEPVAVAFDPSSGRLAIGPAEFSGADRSAELWVIPDGGTPRSVGLLARGEATRIDVRRHIAPLFRRKAQLAVTLEPMGGSPTGKATGPIVASGFIS